MHAKHYTGLIPNCSVASFWKCSYSFGATWWPSLWPWTNYYMYPILDSSWNSHTLHR